MYGDDNEFENCCFDPLCDCFADRPSDEERAIADAAAAEYRKRWDATPDRSLAIPWPPTA